MRLEKGSFCVRILAVLLVAVAAINLSVAAAEFTDAGDIQQVEAVETLVELGVLNGKGTGALTPRGRSPGQRCARSLRRFSTAGKYRALKILTTPGPFLPIRYLRPLGQVSY